MSTEFTDFLIEQMAGFGPVSAQRMFGAVGLYRDGIIFAIVAGDVLYFRVDGDSRGAFEAEGLDSFTYKTSTGDISVMSYMRAPERCLEEPDEMTEWCRKAFEAALRVRKAKKSPRKSARQRRGAGPLKP
jgi:DNA transformation protein